MFTIFILFSWKYLSVYMKWDIYMATTLLSQTWCLTQSMTKCRYIHLSAASPIRIQKPASIPRWIVCSFSRVMPSSPVCSKCECTRHQGETIWSISFTCWYTSERWTFHGVTTFSACPLTRLRKLSKLFFRRRNSTPFLLWPNSTACALNFKKSQV